MVKYICEICKYETDRKSSIDNHNISKKHLTALKFGVNKYPCNLCKKVFDTPKSRWQHENISHATSQTFKFKCDACNLYFKTDKEYKDHANKNQHLYSKKGRNSMPGVKEFNEFQRTTEFIFHIEKEEQKKMKKEFIKKLEDDCKQTGHFIVKKESRQKEDSTNDGQPKRFKKIKVKVNPHADKLEELNLLLKEKQDYFITPEYKVLEVAIKRKMKQEAVRISKQIDELTPKPT
jgi:uncharacterized C2H2 Zn-finger protein